MSTKVESKKMDAADAIEEVTRSKVIVLSNEREVTIRLCRVKDIAVFTKFVALIWDDLGLTMAGVDGSKALLEAQVEARIRDASFILKLISNHADQVFDIMARFSSLPAEEVLELDLDEAVTLAEAVVEVNYAFFMKRVWPVLKAALGEKVTQTLARASK